MAPKKRQAHLVDGAKLEPPEKKPKVEAKPKVEPSSPTSRHGQPSDPLRAPHPNYKESEEHGIVLRKYYPREMSNERARAYTADELPRPIEELDSALADTAEERDKVEVKDAVVHWFKNDLRTSDNRALSLASARAKEAGVPLIGLYVVSPQDFEAHLTSPARVDFTLRTLAILKKDLAELDIPLWVETVEKRKDVPNRIAELMDEWGASHLFTNMEYEVDELRREAKLVRMMAEKGNAMFVEHDTCVVHPGVLHSGSGKPYAVYSPFFRAWVKQIHEAPELLELYGRPEKNPAQARDKLKKLFEADIPEAPESKRLGDEDKKRLQEIWPAGEHEAKQRLDKFVAGPIKTYGKNRNIPAKAGTSELSVYFASGALSARTAIRTARDHNSTKKLDGGNQGIQTWISEVAWRDFYKHVLVHWPYVW